MDFLADSWVLWLVACVLALVGMMLYRQTRRNVITTFSSAEDFSVQTIFFSLRRGEADLFVGFVLAMVSFSFFVLGLVRWAMTSLG